MNIKERFYTNLEMLREDFDQNAATMKRVQDRQEKLFRGLSKAGHGPINTKKYGKRSKYHEKEAKKYQKKAVTGMDEETEQKSKDKKIKKRPLPPMTRKMEQDKSIPGSLASYRDRIYQARKKQLRKEEAEQLDVKKKSDKKDKLFFRSRKMIAVSKLDRNRIRNKDNRKD